MNRKTIKEILTSGVISILPNTPLSDSIYLMERNNISCLIVEKDNRPIGIFTERDLVLLASRGVLLKNLEIKDVMSASVITADEDMDIFEAYRLLTTNRIRHLVAVDGNGEIAGVVTLSNILNKLGLEYFVELKNIESIMTKAVITIGKDHRVSEAVSKMAERSISCIVAVEDNIPIGIITERDVIRLYRRGRDVGNLPIKEVMSRPVETVGADITVHESANIMHQKKIRRLIVVDKDGRMMGLITQHDIVKNFEIKYIDILRKIILEKEQALEETERLLNERIVLDNILRYSTDMAIIATDLVFSIVYYNPAAEIIFGYKAETVIGRSAVEIHAGEGSDPSHFEKSVRIVRNEDIYKYEFERKQGGKARFIESAISGIWDSDGNLAGYVLMARDITKRKNDEKILRANEERNRLASAALQASESRYRQLVTLLPAAVCEIAPDGKVVFSNPAMTAITGYLPEELEGMSLWEILQPRDAHEITDDLQDLFISKDVVNFESTIFSKNGEVKILNWNATRRISDDGVLQSVICIGVDTTELVNLRNKLRETSLMDELTGLKNRRGFIAVAQQQLKIAERNGNDLVLVFMDLDGMKQINDTQGHQAGDIALMETADILRSTFRKADIVARIGGDEFVALLVGQQEINDGLILRRLQEEVAGHNARRDAGIAISLSAGIARYTSKRPCTLDELIKRADASMYTCKQSRRGENDGRRQCESHVS